LQLVASLLAAVIAMIAIGLFLRAHVPGEVVAFTLSAYGLVRFGLELARGDVARPYLLGLSEAQWIAVATTWGCVGLDAQLGLTLGPLYLISACAVSGGAVWLVAAHFHANNAIALAAPNTWPSSRRWSTCCVKGAPTARRRRRAESWSRCTAPITCESTHCPGSTAR